MNTTLDTVSIQIESDAGKSVSNINNLANSLSILKNSIKGGFNNINKLADGLKGLGDASEKLENVSSQIDNISKISDTLKGLNEIANPKGFKAAVDNLSKLPDVMSNITPDALENITRVSNELARALSPLADKMTAISQGFNAISSLANKYGVSVTKVREYTKQTTNHLKTFSKALTSLKRGFSSIEKSSNDFTKSSIKGFESLNSKIKQIALSLLGTRTIFTATRKAVSEYMQMDKELSDATTNLWRALGAQLAPAIEGVMYLFKQFVRVIYSVVKAITGIDLIARANAKATAGWGKSAEDALGSLQKFDDLNVVEFDKGSGDNELIDLTEIDLTPIQKIIDWVRKMKAALEEAFDTGKFYGVGEVLAEGLNSAIDFFINKWNSGRDVVLNVATEFGNFLNGVIDNVDWGKGAKLFGDAIKLEFDTISKFLSTIHWDEVGKGINDAIANIDTSGMLHSIMETLGNVVSGLSDILANIDWSIVGKKISDALMTISGSILNIVSDIDWSSIGEAIRTTIINIDWKSIWDTVFAIFKEAFKGLGEFIDGLFDSDGLGSTVLTIGGIVAALSGLSSLKIGGDKLFGDLITNIDNVGDKVENLKNIFGLLKSDNALSILSSETITDMTGLGSIAQKVLPSIKGVFDLFSGASLGPAIGIIAAVVVGVMALVTAFKNLYENSEPFRTTVDGLIESIKGTLLGVLDNLWSILTSLWDILVQVWKDVLKPLFDLIVSIVEPVLSAVISILDVLWRNAIKPIIDGAQAILMPVINVIIDVIKSLISIIGGVIDVVQWLWTYLLEPIVSFILDIVVGAIKVVGVSVENTINWIVAIFKFLSDSIAYRWAVIKAGFLEAWNYINEKFITPFKEAWEKVVNSIKEAWEKIKSTIKNAINGIIDTINKMINGINDKLTIEISASVATVLNALGVNVSGGKFRVFQIPNIPRLETGTNEIPYDNMLAVLHEGEAVVPKKYNPALGNGNSEEMLERFDRLIFLMENQEQTTNVYVGNKKLYQEQKKYNNKQYNKYGTLEV